MRSFLVLLRLWSKSDHVGRTYFVERNVWSWLWAVVDLLLWKWEVVVGRTYLFYEVVRSIVGRTSFILSSRFNFPICIFWHFSIAFFDILWHSFILFYFVHIFLCYDWLTSYQNRPSFRLSCHDSQIMKWCDAFSRTYFLYLSKFAL